MRYEAVRLFVERARSVAPSFALTEQTASATTRVCHQLDEMPLAIEFATTNTRVLSVEQIASRLDLPETRSKLASGGHALRRGTHPHLIPASS